MSKKRTVCIIGMAPSHLLAPWDDKDIEIWRINEAYKSDPYYNRETRADRWFQLHKEWDFTRNINRSDFDHYTWLQQEHDFPIYMQKVFPDIPSSVRFPLEEIIESFNLDSHTSWFRNSLAYMVALAIYEGFGRIEVYGWELASNTEARYERPSAVFWLGMAKGMHIDIHMPPGCKLMGYGKRHYAFDDVPAVNRMHIESQMWGYERATTAARRDITANPKDEDAKIAHWMGLGGALALKQIMEELDDVEDPRGSFAEED